MNVNIQIVPAPMGLGIGSYTQLPAREGEGEEGPCNVCAGTGRLPRHGTICSRCGGEGWGRWSKAWRFDIQREEDRVRALEIREQSRAEGARTQTTLRCAEEGGGMSNTGNATIICGMKGEKLRRCGGWLHCNGEHAIFYVHSALEVHVSLWRGNVTTVISLISVDNRELKPEHRVLWRDGDLVAGSEDTEIKYPTEAVKAALAKVARYHCREVYYAEGV